MGQKQRAKNLLWILKFLLDSQKPVSVLSLRNQFAAIMGVSHSTFTDYLRTLHSAGFITPHVLGWEITEKGRNWLIDKGEA
jgi:Mn-dependent DtxR family transcriptional regulator